ncbi:MAG: hypothetical protein QOJ70_2782 [Acidobacteriota bacterium]|jgi:hypothetical protein|nr:hypothetical protein [Acidobacteriota bacterium]MDT7808969.1 hypothetical protein [Acidobacteriota bacterium]
MFADDSFLSRLIDNQRSAVRFYRAFAITIFGVGLGVMVLALVWPGESVGERIKTLMTIGGVVISSLSTFQLKEIWNRKDKIAALEAVRAHVGKLNEGDADQAERTRAEEFLSQLVGKIMG